MAQLLFSFLGLFFSATAMAQLAVDPNRDWRMLETDHFEIIYDARQKTLADHVAVEAERAYGLVTQFLNTEKPTKTPLVVEDTTDITNGFAVAIPYAQIHIFPTVPTAVDSISEYENWLRELVRHEFTHIVNFEPTEGVMNVLRTVFGGVVRPAGMLPRWYTEGLAVESESRLTALGRGRSSFYSAMVRAELEAGTWGSESIDRLAETAIPTWPRGLRAYALGYFLMHELSEMKGSTQIYGILNHRYGGRLPFFINGPVEELFEDRDFSDLLEDTYKRVASRAQPQVQAIQTAPVTSGSGIPQDGYQNFGAQISPDGLKLAVITTLQNEDQRIRVYQRANTAEHFSEAKMDAHALSKKVDSLRQLQWRPDSKTLIFDRTDTWRRFNEYYDLYELNLDTQKITRLTVGLRAREPALAEDGSVIFIQASGENTKLAMCKVVDPKCTSAEVLYDPPFGHRLSSPRARGTKIIFAHRDDQAQEWIETFDLETRKIAPVTGFEKGVSQNLPTWDPENPGAFFYSSNATGVMNIYWKSTDKSAEPVPLTNAMTYFTSATYDPFAKDLVFSKLTHEGFRVQTLNLKNRAAVQAPALEPLQNYPAPPPTDSSPPGVVRDEEYKPHRFLLPTYWFPYFLIVPGGEIFDLTTTAADPLFHHTYSLDVGLDTRANKPREAFTYSYAGLPFEMDGGFLNDYVYLAGFNDTLHTTYGFLQSRHFIAGLSNYWTMGPLFEYRLTEYPGSTQTQAGVGYTLSYQDVDIKKDYKISPENGGGFTLGYIYYPQQWGMLTYGNARLSTSYYWSKWLPERHVISVKTTTSYTPEQSSILVGSTQAGGENWWSVLPNPYLARGYPVGEFLGWTVATGNLEYRFPLSYVYKGHGTWPFFHNNWHAALVYDAVTLNGGYFTETGRLLRTGMGTFYSDLGAELRADIKILYSIPLTFRFGYYYGFSSVAQGGSAYYVGFGSVY